MGEVLPIRVIEIAPQTPTAKCHRSLIYDLLQGRRMRHTFKFLTLPPRSGEVANIFIHGDSAGDDYARSQWSGVFCV